LSYALIDNATLTATQRVFGDAKIRNPDIINGDLAAFENLIQAILFSDQLICLDDYKVEFRDKRALRFPFIRFISPTDLGLGTVEKSAREAASKMKPSIVGGKFQDNEFTELIELSKLNMICTWDLRSSVYYLTMKMLGQPNTEEYKKYSQLSSAIYGELAETSETHGYWSKDIRLISSQGHEFTEAEFEQAKQNSNRGFGGTTNGLDMFIASLNWLAYKTIYYSMTARYLEADTYLHPIRHAYQVNWMARNGVYARDLGRDLIQRLASSSLSIASKITSQGRSIAIEYNLPVFTAFFIQKTGKPEDILDLALQARQNSAIAEVRGALREIRLAFEENGYDGSSSLVKKWSNAIQSGCNATLAKYSVDTEQGIQSSTVINIYNTVAPFSTGYRIPGFNFNIPIPDFLKKNRIKAFGTVIKDVVQSLTNIERLGSIRDQLSVSFVYEKDWERIHVPPKTEDPRFARYGSDWKIPM